MMETKNDVFEELLDAYDEETSNDGRLHQTDLLISYGDRFAEALDNEEQDSLPHCHDQEGKKTILLLLCGPARWGKRYLRVSAVIAEET